MTELFSDFLIPHRPMLILHSGFFQRVDILKKPPSALKILFVTLSTAIAHVIPPLCHLYVLVTLNAFVLK